MLGTHIIADFYNIDQEKFKNLTPSNFEVFEKFIDKSLLDNHMTILGRNIHHFNETEGAFTLIYLLAESHLSIHTWPEKNYISLDVYTCGKCNPIKICDNIRDFFSPAKIEMQILHRGSFKD